MKKLLLILLILLPLSKTTYSADKGVIQGVVIDFVTKEPIHGVNIYVRSHKTGAVTNEEGQFELQITAPFDDEIEVSHIAYKPKNVDISLTSGEIKDLFIYLEPNDVRLSEVMITGSRIKKTVFDAQNFVTVKTKEEFTESSHSTTAELLSETPGIIIQKTTHAHGSPIIRGLIGKYVLLLYNGIRLNKPTFRFGANQYMNTVSSNSLNRIEVTRGPASVLYGSDAIGGTVNLIPDVYKNYGDDFKTIAEITTRYSSADNGHNAVLALRGGKKNISFTSSLGYKKIGNVKPGDGRPEQDPTGWEELNGNVNLFYSMNKSNSLEFNYLATDQTDVPRYDKYETGQYEKWIYDPQFRQLASISYILNPALSWLHEVKYNLSYQYEREGRTQRKTGSSNTKLDLDKINTFGSYIQFSSIAGDKHWLAYGAEVYRDEINSNRTITQSGVSNSERGAYPDGTHYNSLGIYFQDNYLLNSKTDIAAGIRYSYYSYESSLEAPWGNFSDDFSNVTGNLNFSYKAREHVNIVGSVSRGFRAPNLYDTVILTVSNSGVDAPSPGLESELSLNYEAGIKFDNDRFRGSWFAFYNSMSELIDRNFGTYNGLSFYDDNGNNVQDPGEVPIFVKANVGEAYIYGSEMDFSYLNGHFIYSGQLFYTFGNNTTTDEPMSRIPPFTGNLGIKWLGDNKWFEINSNYAQKQDRLSKRDILDSRISDGGTPGFFTMNLRGGFDFGNNKIVLRLENLTDEYYKTHGSGIYSPGRHFSILYRVSID